MPSSPGSSPLGLGATDGAGFEREIARTLLSDAGSDLDALDLQLIDHLQRDGRIPYVELARRVEVTEKTVRRRVSRLQSERYVTIAAVTDPSALGFGSVGLVLVATDGSRSPVDVAAELALLPQADYVTVTTGPFAVQVELMCTSTRELHDVAFNTIGSIGGVSTVEILPFLRLHYQQARFSGINGEPDGVRPRPLDELDRAIIAFLAADGRAAFRDFADPLGVSDATIRLRYTKLVESGAVRVMCIVNPLRLGYRFTSWVGIHVGQGGRAQDVAEALTHLSSVSYVAITTGRWDVLAEVVAATGESLLAVLDERIRAIDGVVGLESWLYVALHYKAIRPRLATCLSGHDSDIQIV